MNFLSSTGYDKKFLNLSGSSLAEPDAVQAFLVDNRSLLCSWHEQLRLTILGEYKDNWDGRGSIASSEANIDIAKRWIREISKLVSVSNSWMHPHITLSECGEVVFEWWRNDRKVTLYIAESEATYIKVWGESISDSMEDGELRQASDFMTIWTWLFT